MLEYGRGKTGDVFRFCSTGTWPRSTLTPDPIADGRNRQPPQGRSAPAATALI